MAIEVNNIILLFLTMLNVLSSLPSNWNLRLDSLENLFVLLIALDNLQVKTMAFPNPFVL